MLFHYSKGLCLPFVCLFLIGASCLSGQDECLDAFDLGIFDCDSGTLGEYMGSVLNPDPEAEDCLIGIPAGWFSFEVAYGIETVLIYSDDINVFSGNCSNLSFEDSNCGGFELEIQVEAGETYYILMPADGVMEIMPIIFNEPNQECATAALVLNNSATIHTTCASPSSGSGCPSENNSLWYEYVVENDKTDLEILVENGGILGSHALYFDDCNTLVPPSEGQCTEYVNYYCLNAGTYYIEVSWGDGTPFPIHLFLEPTEINAENDDCIDASETFGEPLACSMAGEWAAFVNGACTDEELTTSCFEKGVWFTFETDETLPYFIIDGENYELFEGECTSLTSIVTCGAEVQVNVSGPTRYYVLVDVGDGFYIEAAPTPTNTDCTSPIELPQEPLSVCCGVDHWYEINQIADAIQFEIDDNSGPELQINFYNEPCGNPVLSGTSEDAPFTLNLCYGDPVYVQLSTETCGEYLPVITPISSTEPFADDCMFALIMDTPESGQEESCLVSDNSYACGSLCNSDGSVWFEIDTDDIASNMLITINGNSSFSPIISVYENSCSNDIIECSEDNPITVPVLPNEYYYIEVASTSANGEFEICISTSADEQIDPCPFDEDMSTVLIENLSNSFSDTDSVIHNIHAFDYSSCDSVCMFLTVDTNGSNWAGPGNLEWNGECLNGTDICEGDIENAVAGPCNDCWDFIAAQLVMNDSSYYLNVLGNNADDPINTQWSTGPIATPSMNSDSGYVDISALTWRTNESLSYLGLTVICHTAPLTDNDNDGIFSDIDCDDNNPNVYPGNSESCDGIDNNCNNLIDEGLSIINYYADNDGDGYGNLSVVITTCEQPAGYVIDNTDCDDTNANINPGVPEIINNDIDENCDGLVEEIDLDEDGFNSSIDCNDNDANVFPGNSESCDDIDNNCDGEIDEGLPSLSYFADNDGDTFGDSNDSLTDCLQPAGYVSNSSDCNDNDPNINPNATEIPGNGIDENCDGIDGMTMFDCPTLMQNIGDNCDDGDINTVDDKVDEDCVCKGLEIVQPVTCPASIEDILCTPWFQDSIAAIVCPTSMCRVDVLGLIQDQATGIEYIFIDISSANVTDFGFGKVYNCDGQLAATSSTTIAGLNFDPGYFSEFDWESIITFNLGDIFCTAIDNDNDGFDSSEDCDDNNPDVYPDAEEICNNIDDNCDGSIDEGFTMLRYYFDGDGDGFGVSTPSLISCASPIGYVLNFDDCDDSNASINPNQIEGPYNGLDDDCNPETLDDDLDQDGFFIADDCDDTNPNINPNATEIPNNGIDENCDGMDATTVVDNDSDGYDNTVDCDDSNPAINPGAIEEPYNGIDDDCNVATLDDDLDQDRFLIADDCDDTNPNINPDAEEIANNGIDEDCDGADLISSIHELSDATLNIYPNPASDFINIIVDGQLEYKATLLDLNGKLILSTKNSKQIQLESIPLGTYLLVITDQSSGQKVVERIVKGR